jgi:hypothetical protein
MVVGLSGRYMRAALRSQRGHAGKQIEGLEYKSEFLPTNSGQFSPVVITDIFTIQYVRPSVGSVKTGQFCS